MFLRTVYDEKLAQAAYLLGCQKSGEAIVFDPERDVDRYLDLAAKNNLRIVAVAETHIHADFVSGVRELAERAGAHVYVSDEGDADWKYAWLSQKIGGGSYSATLLHDGDRFRIGQIDIQAVHTPGHTPEHLCYLVTDRGGGATEPMGLISGDFVFVGDLGRPDLLESAAGHAGVADPFARRLYSSVTRLQPFPDFLQVWPGHGAGSACGKALGAVPQTTLGYERRFNSALKAATDEGRFVSFILSGQPAPPLYFARMKRVNKLGPAVLGKLPTPRWLEAKDLSALDGRRVAILDTRPWAAFREGHIPGSLSAPLDTTFPTIAGSYVGENDDICLVLEPSQLDEATRDLVRVGLDRVVSAVTPATLAQHFASGGESARIREVDATAAIGMVQKGLHVLDVRGATEYANGHVPGAENRPHTRLAAHLGELPREPLLVHCQGGVRSARACALLQRAGFDVTNLAGGYMAWQRNGGAVEA